MLEIGIKGKQELTVTDELTAKRMGSGGLDVFATPALIAIAEKTALISVSDRLGEGVGTVGTKVTASHISATPLGMKVWCETVLSEIDGRRLVFRFEAFDEAGKIGEGEHERFIIKNEKFMKKAEDKKLRR